MEDKNQLQLYTVWSNFIYFVVAIYSICIAISYLKTKKIPAYGFIIYGTISFFVGLFSILYHLQTISWTGDMDSEKKEEHVIFHMVDKIFAIMMFIIMISVFFGLSIYKTLKESKFDGLLDPNFYFTIIFCTVSIIFYLTALNHNSHAVTECKNVKECIDVNLDGYDMLHSNWHLFTGVSSIFWLSFIKNLVN